MFITKKHISRRTVLKGAGAAIALPLLDAMSPAGVAWGQTAAGKTPHRLAFVGFPHGAVMRHFQPAETGRDYTMTRILEPLAPFREHMTLVTGLRNKPAESPEPHEFIERTWLSCVSPKQAGVIGPDAGVTADQFAARHIGQETRIPSLELTTSLRGAQLAWRTPLQSLPQEMPVPVTVPDPATVTLSVKTCWNVAAVWVRGCASATEHTLDTLPAHAPVQPSNT